jgi:hypothetical protein
MDQMIITTPPQEDEIVLSLIEQKTVTHDTVRINVTVAAQRDAETDETELRQRIRAVLRKFIEGEWRFTGVQRLQGQTRFEIVNVQAVVRASESENRQLAERAKAVSQQGLELVNPLATYALPVAKVREINRDLRVALAAQAAAECALYNKNVRPSGLYRVAVIEFADTWRLNAPSALGAAQTIRASSAYATANNVYTPSGGSGAEPDVEEGGADLGVSERFWVAAQVTLRAKIA